VVYGGEEAKRGGAEAAERSAEADLDVRIFGMAAVLGGYDFIDSLSVFLSALRGLRISLLSNQVPQRRQTRAFGFRTRSER